MDLRRYLLSVMCLLIMGVVTGCLVTFEDNGAIVDIEIDSPPPPPPPQVVLIRPARPSPHHVWIGGHHIVTSGTWVWVRGHWAKPPHNRATWMPCHTRQKNKIWVWTPGYWR